jgi:hypothetical protein
MSYFKKIAYPDEDEIIRLPQAEVITIKNITYRRAFHYGLPRQDEIWHYIFEQEHLNKINIANRWYVEIKPHKCIYHCKDDGQTEKEWIRHCRSLVGKDGRLRRILKAMENYGYSNVRKNGYVRID